MLSLLARLRTVLAVTLLGVAALILSGFSLSPVVTVVTAVAGLTLIINLQGRALLGTGIGYPGSWAIARTMLLGTAVVLTVSEDLGAWRLPTLAAVAVLLTLTAFESRIGRVWGAGTRVVSNLPGFDRQPGFAVWGGRAQLVHLVALGLCLVAPLVPPLGGVALALVLGLGAVTALWTVQARRERPLVGPALRAALQRHAAPVMVHLTGPSGTQYQLGVWLHELERLVAEGTRVVVIVRESSLARLVGQMTDLPVVAAPTIAALEGVQLPTFRIALYVNNGAKNAHNVRYRDLMHVQLLHGDSDKPSSFNPVTAMFDKIFVAGQAGIDRYHTHGVPIPRDKFVIVGRPQVAEITLAGAGGPRPDGGPTAGADAAAFTVLYAPTWAGFNQDNSFGSLAWGEEIVRGLLEHGWRVVFRPHPFSLRDRAEAAHANRIESLLAADATASGRQHVFGARACTELSLVECFNLSDALVSDVSSVPADYLYSGKPFVITQVDEAEPDAFVAEFPLARGAYVARLREPGSLGKAIEGLDGDILAGSRDDIRKYYLGDIPRETYARTFRDAVRALVVEAGASSGRTSSVHETAGVEEAALEDLAADVEAGADWSEV